MNRNARHFSAVLADIVAVKRAEVETLRRDAKGIRNRAEDRAAGPGFEAALRGSAGINVIAEVKRRSPSAGEIRADAPAAEIARVYSDAGAAAVSVLTDAEFFGGALSDLEAVADAVAVPVLRKDFMVDEVQVWEARAAGASAILLIVRILDDAELADLMALADDLELGALVEVHDEREMERALKAGARVIGVNNRDLDTFTTDLAVTERIARDVPGDRLLVGESGIRTAADVERLADAGADAVLVGETLMRAADPAAMIQEFSGITRRGRR